MRGKLYFLPLNIRSRGTFLRNKKNLKLEKKLLYWYWGTLIICTQTLKASKTRRNLGCLNEKFLVPVTCQLSVRNYVNLKFYCSVIKIRGGFKRKRVPSSNPFRWPALTKISSSKGPLVFHRLQNLFQWLVTANWKIKFTTFLCNDHFNFFPTYIIQFFLLGYLAASQAFNDTTEVLMLTTNLIRKDLLR